MDFEVTRWSIIFDYGIFINEGGGAQCIKGETEPLTSFLSFLILFFAMKTSYTHFNISHFERTFSNKTVVHL